MVKTIGQLIQTKYTQLQQDLLPYTPPNKYIFPSLEDIDLSDLLFFISNMFPINETDYRSQFQDLLDLQGIQLSHSSHFEKVYEIGLPFIQFIRSL
jgi:hypothetical protein